MYAFELGIMTVNASAIIALAIIGMIWSLATE